MNTIYMGLQRSGDSVLIDSSAWIALSATHEIHHLSMKKVFEDLRGLRTPLVTTEMILAETLTRLRYDENFRAAEKFYETIQASVLRGFLRVLRSESDTFQAAWAIMSKYRDHKLSFVDCMSAVQAHSARILRVFTLDRDFTILGFTVLN